MNKPVSLRLSILELSKNIMHEFWYDYVKLIYGEKTKLGYMDTGNFTVHVNTDDINKDVAKMLKQSLTLYVMTWTDHYQKETLTKLLV